VTESGRGGSPSVAGEGDLECGSAAKATADRDHLERVDDHVARGERSLGAHQRHLQKVRYH